MSHKQSVDKKIRKINEDMLIIAEGLQKITACLRRLRETVARLETQNAQLPVAEAVAIQPNSDADHL